MRLEEKFGIDLGCEYNQNDFTHIKAYIKWLEGKFVRSLQIIRDDRLCLDRIQDLPSSSSMTIAKVIASSRIAKHKEQIRKITSHEKLSR